MYICNICIKLFLIIYFVIDSFINFFLFEIKLKVNYIDLNFKFILIIEDVEDVKFGYVMWCNIMGICVLKCVC